ncbi:hypothetical protein D3C76_1756350 [compost metagenome]
MPEYTSAWLVEEESTQYIISLDPARLLPKCLPWWWCNPANNDVADFTFGVAANNVNNF